MTVAVWLMLGGLILGLDIWRALSVTPIPDGDALFFYPVYLSVARGNGLANPLVSPLADTGGPYVWHGWLQPLLLGRVASLLGGQMPGVLLSETAAKMMGLAIYLRWVRTTTLASVLGAITLYVALTA